MQRFLAVGIIFLICIVIEKCFMNRINLDSVALMDQYSGMGIVFIGIFVGGVYWIKYGRSYSCLIANVGTKRSSFVLFNSYPGKKYVTRFLNFIWKFIEPTTVGKYLSSIYQKPVESEQFLGGFFFGKTLITTAIAFYYVDTLTLLGILAFSAIFDSWTGVYQQTLMNYFHKTIFENKVLKFTQNLFKRYIVDVFRAEVLTLILMGIQTLTWAEQFHILQNRFVSASYYFNAVVIDKLVDMGAISRNFRSRFVIFASTAGGLLCLLDFAKTDFPAWMSPELIAGIPSWVPGPLVLLGYFNLTVFLISIMTYGWVVYFKKWADQVNQHSVLKRNIIHLIQGLLR